MTQDFTAYLEFRKTEDGGRIGYASSGYRPHLEFDNYPEYLTSGSFEFLDKEKVFPGESAYAKIDFVSKAYFSKRLYIGKYFKFCEGSKTMGVGKIIEIINKNLEANSSESDNEYNLNTYPKDIIDKIKIDFGKDYTKAMIKLQDYLKSNPESRSARIIRSMIFLSAKKIEDLAKNIEIAKKDWELILFMAEYENQSNPVKVRDFNKEFGNEIN